MEGLDSSGSGAGSASGMEYALAAGLTAEEVVRANVMEPLDHWTRTVLAGTAVFAGLLVCVLGVRVVKFCFFLLGFGLGAVSAGILTWKLTQDDEKTLIATFGAGVFVGSMCLCVVRAGKFVAGAAIGFFPVFLFIQLGLAKALGGNIVAWVALGAALLLAGLLLYKIKHLVLTLATAYGGALAMALGASFFLQAHVDIIAFVNDPEEVECSEWRCFALASLWVFFGSVGVVAQCCQRVEALDAKETSRLTDDERADLAHARAIRLSAAAGRSGATATGGRGVVAMEAGGDSANVPGKRPRKLPPGYRRDGSKDRLPYDMLVAQNRAMALQLQRLQRLAPPHPAARDRRRRLREDRRSQREMRASGDGGYGFGAGAGAGAGYDGFSMPRMSSAPSGSRRQVSADDRHRLRHQHNRSRQHGRHHQPYDDESRSRLLASHHSSASTEFLQV